MIEIPLLVGLVAWASGCGAAQKLPFEFRDSTKGAERVTLSPSGSLLLSEWRYTSPPTFRLDHLTDGTLEEGTGWVFGAPSDSGDVLLLDPDLKRVSWMRGRAVALQPPEMELEVRALTMSRGRTRAFVVLSEVESQGRGVWIAAVDAAAMKVLATKTFGAPQPPESPEPPAVEHNCLAAEGEPATPLLLLTCWTITEGKETITVRALGEELEPAWSRVLDLGGHMEVRAVVTGDGRQLLLLAGWSNRRPGLLEPSKIIAIDLATGEAKMAPYRGPRGTDFVNGVAPVPGTTRVALLHIYTPDEHNYLGLSPHFVGVSLVDAGSLQSVESYLLEQVAPSTRRRYQQLTGDFPKALAVRADGTIVLGRDADR